MGGVRPGAPAPSDAAVQALRERAATALERAYAFVERHGEALPCLVAEVVLEVAAPDAVARLLAERQAPDGSLPPFVSASPVASRMGPPARGPAGAASESLRLAAGAPVLGALEALALLASLGVRHGAPLERAAAFLERAQNADGSWGADGAPEELRVVLTGCLAGTLGTLPAARAGVLDAAGAYLGERWEPERVARGEAAVLAAFARFFSNVDHEASDAALQWCGRELERGFRSGLLDALAVATVLLDCEASAQPGASLAPGGLGDALLREQAADGGFDELAPGGPADRVAPTLDAMRALIATGRRL